MNSSNAYRVGVAGLGTVGAGVVRLLHENAALIARRAGKPIEVVAVSARDREKDRGVDLSRMAFEADATRLADRDDVDVVIEAIGGENGVALDLCHRAIMSGKDVVTANKAMLAHRGFELAREAEAQAVGLAFEAAVAGGVPIVKALREGLAANRILRVQGILNGTCNYILSAMRESGRPFAEILKEAQELGYAEAEPSLDVDGIDAAHKLALLAAIAFGVKPRFDAIEVEGVRGVTPTDIAFASELGYRVKLLGSARLVDGALEQRLFPVFVPENAPIAQVEGVFNAVAVEGDHVDRTLFEGRGAGAGPTASAMVADLIDLARGLRAPAFGVKAGALEDAAIAPKGGHVGAYYLRLSVIDEPGVLSLAAGVLARRGVSVQNVIQRVHNPKAPVAIAMTTHGAVERAMISALEELEGLEPVVERPTMIRIEN